MGIYVYFKFPVVCIYAQLIKLWVHYELEMWHKDFLIKKGQSSFTFFVLLLFYNMFLSILFAAVKSSETLKLLTCFVVILN